MTVDVREVGTAGSDEFRISIARILGNINDPSTSLITKYQLQNELKQLSRAGPEAHALVKMALNLEIGFIHKKLLLDCELQAYNINYLIDLIINGEYNVLVKYALSKYSWIFKQDSPLNDPKYFEEKLLNIIPYSMRNLILWQIMKNCHNQPRCEALYGIIEKRIGSNVAVTLLPACSATFVTEIFQRDKCLTLSYRQLSWLLKTHPVVAIDYLGEHASTYPNMFRRIIRINPVTFANLYEKTSFPINLGPSETKTLNKACSNRILENMKIYAKILHPRTLYSLVDRATYIRFVTIILPPTLEDFRRGFQIHQVTADWINCLPMNVDKGNLFKDAFAEKYGIALLDCASYIHTEVLPILGGVDRDLLSDRKLAEISAENRTGHLDSVQTAEWIAYKPIEKSIPAIKLLISEESDHGKRQRMLEYLLKSCHINRDGVALNDVCKYYVERHRNETNETHRRFLIELNDFDIKNFVLDPSSIQNFIEIFKFYMLTTTRTSFLHISEKMLQKVYTAQLKANLCTSEILPILYRIKFNGVTTWSPNWTFKKDEHLTPHYLSFMERLTKDVDFEDEFKSDDQLVVFIIGILTFCRDWNRYHPTRVNITRFPTIQAKLLEISGKLENITTNLLGLLTRVMLHDSVLSKDLSNPIFLRCLELCPNDVLIQHFLHHDVTILSDHWEDATNFLFTTNNSLAVRLIITRLKWNGYQLHLDQLKQELLEKFTNDEIDAIGMVQAMEIASLTLPMNKYFDLASKYYPKTDEPAEKPEDFFSHMRACQGICQFLRNVENPTLALPSLMKFCRGDTLKFVVGSLYSIVFNSKLELAEKFVLELCRCPAVSVKKHAIRLMTQISFKDGLCHQLMSLWAKDKHRTITGVILVELLRRLNYDDTAFISLQEAVKSVSINDKEAIHLLLTFDKLPPLLVEDFGLMLWHKCQEDDPDKKVLSGFILGWVNMYFEKVSAEWMLRILENQAIFLEDEDGNQILPLPVSEALAVFLARTFLKSSSLQSNLLGILENALDRTKISGTLEDNGVLFKIIVNFTNTLCRLSFSPDQKLDTNELVQLFEAIQSFSFYSSARPETFALSFFLKCTTLMHSDSDKSVHDKGRLFGRLMDESIGEHGPGIFPFWTQLLRTFVQDMWRGWISDPDSKFDPDFMLELAMGLVESDTNLDEKMILALTLMPVRKPKGREVKEKYEMMLRTISKSSSFLVQLRLVDKRLEIQEASGN